MKALSLFLCSVLCLTLISATAQDCVDPNQIDPDIFCTQQYDPVCGCDGETYSNECYAYYFGGVTSWTPGECPPPQDCVDPSQIDPDIFCTQQYDPVCGCNGETYTNECYAYYFGGVTSWTPGECPPAPDCMDLAGIDFGLCDMALGIAMINGTCQSVSGCDWTVDGVDYSSYFYESMDLCQACEPECMDLGDIDFGECEMAMGIAFVNGSCSFVSGCGFVVDNVDYSPYFFENMEDCQANCGGGDCIDPSVIDDQVLCEGTYAPICGCDGVTYWNECVAYYYHGITQFEEGPCSCPDPAIADPNQPCPLIWDPVCGCDGVTYSNDCIAFNQSGITIWTQGECPPDSTECMDLSGIDFGPCDAVLGVGVINGQCVWISGCSLEVDSVDYSPYVFEDMSDCQMQCDSLGSCIDPLQIDTTFVCDLIEFEPVCGCDSITYVNACVAEHHHGLTSWTAGPCANSCEHPWQQQNFGCPENWDPVCGCDSITYGNECEAWYYGGISQWTPGECDSTNAVLNQDPLKQVILYPNPASGKAYITGVTGQFTWEILDLTGRVISRGQSANATTSLDVESLSPGLYVVQLRARDQKIGLPLMIEKE